MKKETFVGIINAILNQREREEKFTEAIQKAFVDAGDLAEFHNPEGFRPPTGLFIDEILNALSCSFVGPNQTQEEALDHINYFVYELDMMNYVFMEPVDPEKNSFEVHAVPAHYTSKDGTEHNISTPEELYESLVYEMTAKRPMEDSKAMYQAPTQEDLCNSVMQEVFKSQEYQETLDKVLDVVRNQLGDEDIAETSDIHTDIIHGADSIDEVEIFMKLEKVFDIHFTDEELEDGYSCDTPRKITLFLLSRNK